MNIKQAIAYLVSKIQKACYAARFFITIIFCEIPHGHHRTIHKSVRGRVCNADNAPNRGIEAGGARPVEPIQGQEGDDSQGSISDELLGFWAGDPLDRFHHPNDQRSASAQGCSTQDLRDEPQVQQCLHPSGEWDLLDPTIRQAIILDKMREYQSRTEDYCVFSTRDVAELCDRADVQWDLVFEDLTVLNRQLLVKINVVECDRTGKFIGLFWGLR